MADVQARIAPFINKRFVITSPWWADRDGTIHRGLDISTGSKDPVYSMIDGVVVKIYNNDPSIGNGIIIRNPLNRVGTLYMHLDSISVSLSERVLVGQKVGIEGTTGESTGIHLHVEMQEMLTTTWKWTYNKSDYIDPTQFMVIPNVKNTWVFYNGSPTPSKNSKKKKFKWVLYAEKIRNN